LRLSTTVAWRGLALQHRQPALQNRGIRRSGEIPADLACRADRSTFVVLLRGRAGRAGVCTR
ncbi:MAG TPA: hypothetical protein VHH53_03930, partial [Pseudonocardiaceae bacterium]|nr:hypothetical protein [Pseudonocardiaceae bacterium]